MVHDLVIMASSADRSGGDVAIPIAVGETTVAGNGVPGTGTQWYPNYPGYIVQAFCNSETGAAADVRFHKTTDVNWNHLYTTHLQTDPVRTQVLNNLAYPIGIGDAIEAQGTTAGAQLDVLGLYVMKQPGRAVNPFPPAALPAGAMLVEATGATTLTADAITEGVITFVDWTPQRDVRYRILGMGMDGATACASRLKFLEGPNVNDHPGVIAADTSTGLEYMIWYGDFGTFKGQNPPWHQTIGVAGDTAQVFKFVIVPEGSAKQ